MKRLLTTNRKTLLTVALLCSTLIDAEALAGGNTYPQCAAARDPARCEARLKAQETCRELRGATLRDCMSSQRPPLDCSKARYPERCLARQKAEDACRDRPGPERRKCLRER